MIKTIQFPCWPTWNFHFPEIDVVAITAVKYYDAAGVQQNYPLDNVRLTCAPNGVSGITFIDKNILPPLEPVTIQHGVKIQRADAVTIEYQPPDEPQGLLTHG
jgi:hypothetical protein